MVQRPLTSTRLPSLSVGPNLRTIFDESTRIPTQVLLPDLWKLEESPWGDWNYGRPLTARQLAGILKPYGVKPKDYDFSGIKLKGYDVADGLGDAWRRYCAKEPAAPYGEGNKSDKRKPPASDVADTEHVADPQWEDRDHRARAPESNDPLQWDESGGVQL